MKKFKIPVSWEVSSEIIVKAESLEEAIKIFDDIENNRGGYLLPDSYDYVDGSFERGGYELIKLINEE